MNGDGYADVIVGAPVYDAGETTRARRSCSSAAPAGIADGNPATAAAQLESDQAARSFGLSVAGAGDVNGDGYADVIVGAPAYDAARRTRARRSCSSGSASGIADGNPATRGGAARVEPGERAARERAWRAPAT